MIGALSLLALGLGTTLVMWPGIMQAAVAPRWAFLAVMIPICLLANQRESMRWRWGALIALVCAFSLSQSIVPLNGVDDLIHVAIMVAAFHLGGTLRDTSLIWLGIELGIAILSVLVIAQLSGFTGVPQIVPPAGTFMNKNLLGEMALVASVTSLVAGSWLLIPAAFVLLVTTSKAAIGAFFLVVALRLLSNRSLQTLAVMILGMIAVAGLYAFTMPSGEVRLSLWEQSLPLWTLMGNGLGSYSLFFPEAYHAHSEAVQLMFELGLFSIPIFIVIIYALGAYHERSPEWFVVVALGATALVSFPFHIPSTAFAFAFAAGHLVARRDRVRLLLAQGRGTLAEGLRRAKENLHPGQAAGDGSVLGLPASLRSQSFARGSQGSAV